VKVKNIFIALLVLTAATVAFGGYTGSALAATQGNLCGTTNGNGQIISVGDTSFTLKQNNGAALIVTLANGATIETSNGPATLSDLKIGDRVTLVGDAHRDGTFTADAVLLCSATQESGAGQANSIAVQNENSEKYDKVNGTINTVTLLFVGLVWLGMCVFLLLKKRKSFVYLLFFTIFYIYLYKMLDYTLLQFQSLLLLQHFVPNLMLRGVEAGKSVNLIPLATLTLEDVKTSMLNILMMLPFGFGLPFITRFRFKQVVITGLLLSVVIEFLQFVTGFMANMTFRVADINDLIFNTLGVATGFILFVAFVRMYRHIFRYSKVLKNPILRYIAERPQVDA